jgi:hypothetical protein
MFFVWVGGIAMGGRSPQWIFAPPGPARRGGQVDSTEIHESKDFT